ncbi:MAG: Methyltransferase type 12 [Solirubrobacterales bacterium]|nr:Methyltransferase type 12 [Solirubrobacterales bacterium]
MTVPASVIWHDVECGSYDADLSLWRALAEGARGPVLDVGAGTGRVSLDLARRGHEVIALDADADLLRELDARATAASLRIDTVCADARDFDLGRALGMIIVPMQTLQLLGGPDGRAAFLRSAARHLAPGALLAAALADALEGQLDNPLEAAPALPDIREVEGTIYASHPIGIRVEPGGVVIERIRETVAPDGTRHAEGDEIRLDRTDAAMVAAEAATLGFSALEALAVPATDEYVGSEVVLLCRS